MYKWTISAGRDRRRNRPAWVAISHGEIIGWCTIVGGLIGVFVRPDFRRQGIGTKLAERMIRGQGKIFASGDRPFRRKFYERFEDIILIQA